MKRFWRLLSPGMGLKRWLFLCFFGVFLVAVSFATGADPQLLARIEQWLTDSLFSVAGRALTPAGRGLLVGGAGVALITLSLVSLTRAVTKALSPQKSSQLLDTIYRRKQLQKGPKIVVLGGGTGLAVLLRSLKEITGNITAIVTVADDGGSSGRLRDELGILPPGDIRNCLLALADTEPLMEKLFQYRFGQGTGLAGHSFGNLFIAAMTEITGDFELGIKESSKVLAVRGQVLPSSLAAVRLQAEYTDGSTACGESVIPRPDKAIARVSLLPEAVTPPEEALTALQEADLIILGPGSLYTSILPNLLVERITAAIKAATVPKLYICNIMTQAGETDGYTVSRHVQAILDHSGAGVIDYVLVNTQIIPPQVQQKYAAEGAYPVPVDREHWRRLPVRILEANLVSGADFARHDPAKLAKVVLWLAEVRRRSLAASRLPKTVRF